MPARRLCFSVHRHTCVSLSLCVDAKAGYNSDHYTNKHVSHMHFQSNVFIYGLVKVHAIRPDVFLVGDNNMHTRKCLCGC